MTRILVKYGDERLTIGKAAERAGISMTAMRWRIFSGWPKEKLFSTENHRIGPRIAGSRAKLQVSKSRPLKELRTVIEEYSSPFAAAVDGQLSAEEYLALEKELSPVEGWTLEQREQKAMHSKEQWEKRRKKP